MTKFADRFVLEREIGAGGMARVFLGRDEVLERSVAVKVLNPGYGGTDIGDRFRREGRTAARLSHPNVVAVYGAGEGEIEGREVSYIVMEYIPGGDLKALIDKEGNLPDVRLARLGAEVSSGLAHAHEKGVIHRDIKPHNVLIDTQDRSKLTDFGIARALDTTQATQTGSYLGTALYSSPEQLRGERVTPKSDVYSLGITLYQAATGAAPFTGSPIEVATQHISKPPPELDAPLSETTESLILDCLRKDPDHRPTAEEAHDRLLDVAAAARPARSKAPPISPKAPARGGRTRDYLSEASTAKPTPIGGARRGARRGPIALAAAALLLLLLLGAVYAATLGEEDPGGTAQAPQEEVESQPAVSPEDAESGDTAGGAGGSEDQKAVAGKEETKASGAGDDAPEEDPPPGDPSQEDPARTVQAFYQAAADEDYGRASGLMTPNWRQRYFPEQGQFEGTFTTLESIRFVEGPTVVAASGNTATVTGETIAEHTDRTERNGGTWVLLYENGEWRIDSHNVYNITTE